MTLFYKNRKDCTLSSNMEDGQLLENKKCPIQASVVPEKSDRPLCFTSH